MPGNLPNMRIGLTAYSFMNQTRMIKIQLWDEPADGKYDSVCHEAQAHYDLVLKTSPYIKRLVEEQPAEDIVVVRLYESNITHESCWHIDDVNILLNAYVKWLYTGNIAIMAHRPSVKSPNRGKRGDKEFRRLYELYELARLLEDTHFENSVLDAFVAKNRNDESCFLHAVNADWILKMTYATEPQASKLRDLLATLCSIDICAEGLTPDAEDGFPSLASLNFPEPFMMNIACKLLRRMPNVSAQAIVKQMLDRSPGADRSTTCDFHVHDWFNLRCPDVRVAGEDGCTHNEIASQRKRKRLEGESQGPNSSAKAVNGGTAISAGTAVNGGVAVNGSTAINADKAVNT